MSLLCGAVCLAAAGCRGDTIFEAGDVLQVDFSILAPQCPGGPCDVLLAMPTADGSFGVQPGDATLLDGQRILGSQGLAYTAGFRASDSLYSPSIAATVDFSSILDGTIDGVLEFTILAGAMRWSGDPGMTLLLGRAISPGLVMTGTGLTVRSVAIVPQVIGPGTLGVTGTAADVSTPEPNTVWLMLLGLAALWGIHRWHASW